MKKKNSRVQGGKTVQERMKKKYQEEAYKGFANYMMDELGFMKKYGIYENMVSTENVYSVISEFMDELGITPKDEA